MSEAVLEPRAGARALEHHFARMLATRCRSYHAEIEFAGAMLMAALAHGDVCVDIADETAWPNIDDSLTAPSPAALRAALLAEDTVCGPPNSSLPLILDGDRLYLHRYHAAESRIAQRLQQMASVRYTLDQATMTVLDGLFPDSSDTPDHQRLACEQTLQRGFSIISGGPGTGKTTTVARLLVAYMTQQIALGRRPVVRLAAPTGKAAARVSESMQAQLQGLRSTGQISHDVIDRLPSDAQTLHRLLGARGGGNGFRHGLDNPLALDLLIVDECSMIDMRLCRSLLDALPDHARLIMLGDPEQLAAVDAGNVFAELNALQGACSTLTYSHRFAAVPAIGQLAGAINRADSSQLAKLLENPEPGISVRRYQERLARSQIDELAAGYQGLLAAIADGAALEDLLQLQGRYQVLCALRDGPFGVTGLNGLIETSLAAGGLIDIGSRFYPGRPLMITRNDHALRLYNGDVGLVVKVCGELRAVFPNSGDGTRAIPVSRLPAHESAWAMTVHKSQGSEFDHVSLILPPPDSAAGAGLVRRELVYTGITRARREVELVLPQSAIPQRWLSATARRSGLAERLQSIP